MQTIVKMCPIDMERFQFLYKMITLVILIGNTRCLNLPWVDFIKAVDTEIWHV